MARAFAQLTEPSFSLDGTIHLKYSVTYMDVVAVFMSTCDVELDIDALDTASAMKTKISDAIKAKGTELGLTINSSDITMPAFTKG